MDYLLKLEYIGLFALSLFIFWQTDYVWWVYAVWFLAPDIGMLGYAINTKVGAFSYNLLHHYAIAVAALLVGLIMSMPVFVLAGSIILGHAAFDRILGYGLKYPDSFKHTHLKQL